MEDLGVFLWFIRNIFLEDGKVWSVTFRHVGGDLFYGGDSDSCEVVEADCHAIEGLTKLSVFSDIFAVLIKLDLTTLTYLWCGWTFVGGTHRDWKPNHISFLVTWPEISYLRIWHKMSWVTFISHTIWFPEWNGWVIVEMANPNPYCWRVHRSIFNLLCLLDFELDVVRSLKNGPTKNSCRMTKWST